MADIAQMRFRSTRSPGEYGILALSDDGLFRVVPSEAFRDEMGRLEEAALHRSQTYGIRAGAVLVILGFVALGLGWLLGRIAGKLGSALSMPRPIQDVRVLRESGGGIRVIVRGLEHRLQKVEMAWNADEVLQPEVDNFLRKLDELKGDEA